ncbi:MAG: tRNA (adenosine(37)-N6)-threonylcarbamoyltransferase complex ATPase subunit type 1 TsaE [Clostridia bacterium]|nr:tRNA (adenosine(37)-N6)-threonylcarbamoyltransferase complex ATPase subunit type 1 TsaE [Clostridia bacterium]
MQTFISDSEAETGRIAQEICKKIPSGSLVLFTGDMGAGKTTFMRGALQAYGNDAFVSSPTFALVNDYGGDPHIYHFDMYRVDSVEDLFSTGFFDYLGADSILFVEWSENIRSFLSPPFFEIDIAKTPAETQRIITVKGSGF